MRPIAPKKSRFADEIRRKLRREVVQLYNDGVVQEVTFAYLIS